jgi:hypothetical protein
MYTTIAQATHEYGLTVFQMVMGAVALGYGAQQLTLFFKNYMMNNSHGLVIKQHAHNDLNYAPLNPMSIVFFNQCNVQDFENMCNSVLPQNYTQEEAIGIRKSILQQYNMYRFQGFRIFIERFPEFTNHILETAERLKMDKDFYKKIYAIQYSGKRKGVCDYINSRARILEK